MNTAQKSFPNKSEPESSTDPQKPLRAHTYFNKFLEKYKTLDGNGKDGLIHISIEDHNADRAAELTNGYIDQFRKLSEHLAISAASHRRLLFEQQLEQAKDNLANAEEGLKETEQKTGLIQFDGQARALIESAATLRAEIVARGVQIQGMQTYATRETPNWCRPNRSLRACARSWPSWAVSRIAQTA